MSNHKSVLDLAERFAEDLQNDVGHSAMNQINQRNQSLVEGACASHDFCDANAIMCEAFAAVFGREPNTLNDNADIALWGDAWNIAKECEFSISAIRRYFDR